MINCDCATSVQHPKKSVQHRCNIVRISICNIVRRPRSNISIFDYSINTMLQMGVAVRITPALRSACGRAKARHDAARTLLFFITTKGQNHGKY